MDNKIVVAAKDGHALVRIGNDMIALADESMLELETNDIESFTKYLMELPPEHEPYSIYYGETNVTAMPNKASYHSKAFAHCGLSDSVLMAVLKRFIREGITHTLTDFEDFLHSMTSAWKMNAKEVYDLVRDFSLKKITHIERKKDNRGNFHYCVSRKDEREDVAPPEQITFELPVFKFLADTITLTFDVVMSYSEDDEDSVDVRFRLKNPLFEEYLQERQTAIISGVLAKTTMPCYWGNINLHQQTDEWRHKENVCAG